MFHVKVKIMPSKINGLGLFADEDIPKDSKVYSINESLDLEIPIEKFNKISENEQQTIKHYGYFNNKKNVWYLSFDDIRFCNHSLNGNITLKENNLISTKDIKKDEEITQNYKEFETLRKELSKSGF